MCMWFVGALLKCCRRSSKVGLKRENDAVQGCCKLIRGAIYPKGPDTQICSFLAPKSVTGMVLGIGQHQPSALN